MSWSCTPVASIANASSLGSSLADVRRVLLTGREAKNNDSAIVEMEGTRAGCFAWRWEPDYKKINNGDSDGLKRGGHTGRPAVLL